jgi:hypothetical protein
MSGKRFPAKSSGRAAYGAFYGPEDDLEGGVSIKKALGQIL